MGLEFIGRVVRTAAIVSAVASLLVATYVSLAGGAGLLVGTAWGSLNLLAIKSVVRSVIARERPSKADIAKTLAVKFPLLYGLGLLLLWFEPFPVVTLLAGFSLVLLTIFLKALGAQLANRWAVRSLGALMLFLALAVSAVSVAVSVSSGAVEPAAVNTAEAAGAHESHVASREAGGHEAPDGAEGPPELPNIVTVLYDKFGSMRFAQILHHWENVFFSLLITVILGVLSYCASRKPQLVPRGLQNVLEMAVESLSNFVCGILGKQGRDYVPFLGTLFIYILCMNVFGLIPGMKSPSSSINTTVALAVTVFVYVQYTGIRKLGILGYLDHFAGQPRDAVGIALVPLMFPLHIISELAKPLSLSLRLFGNILGEDVLIAVFVGLGVGMLGFLHLPVGVPLQFPFIFLAILTSTVQALVFASLSTIYFLMMFPHEEH
ncbi:MAG: F0F1 ATP synthase subunit A [Candidatus Eisenbacteria bacterium]